MTVLTVVLYNYAQTKQKYYWVDWPLDQSLLCVRLAVDMAGLSMLSSIYKSFVLANIAPGHRAYFAAISNDDHKDLKSILESCGETYYERSEVTGKKRVGRNLFEILTLGRLVPDKVSALLASTANQNVIETIFDSYQQEWWMHHFAFPFLVADHEPSGWVDQLAKFSMPADEHVISPVPSRLIDESRCLMLTQSEHGIDMVSDKIDQREIEKIARDVASTHSLEFRTMWHQAEKRNP